MSERIDVIRGSDNVFRDFGYPDAEVWQLKAGLAAEIIGILRKRRLSQRKAAAVTGIDQADISRIKNADLKGFTIDRLVTVLNHLDRSVEIKVKQRRRKVQAARVIAAE